MSDPASLHSSCDRTRKRTSSLAPEPFSYLPELAAPYQENDKEVTGSDEKQPVEILAYALPQSPYGDAPELQYDSPGETNAWSSRSRTRFIWICVSVLIIVALAVGLGVGLSIGLRSSE